MTMTADELEALVAKAGHGKMIIEAGANSHCFDGRLCVNGECIGFVELDLDGYSEDGSPEGTVSPDADLICKLWNNAPALIADRRENERLKQAGQTLADAAAAAIHGLPEMLERNALSDEEGMVPQIEMALETWRKAALEPRP